MPKILHKLKQSFLFLQIGILFALPASGNYTLKSYQFGGGGGESQSANYGIEGAIEQGGVASSAGYGIQEGLVFQQNTDAPTATLENSNNWYNKLHVTIIPWGNATDTTYAIAISSDGFATTNYVQSDNTIGASLGGEDYQTYANWGSATGEDIIGLTPNTTYLIKVKAIQGQYTESAYGPVASAATQPVTLSFDIDIGSAANASTDAPYAIDFGVLTIGSVTTASDKIWVDLSTNAEYGGYIYVYGTNNGLRSSNTNYTITSATANLTSAEDGYGLQAANSSGLSPATPYDGTLDSVGIVSTTIREILNSANSPVTNGRGSITIKAKTTTTTPASNDYTDTLTLISSGTF
jgi:hypothetical protein